MQTKRPGNNISNQQKTKKRKTKNKNCKQCFKDKLRIYSNTVVTTEQDQVN